MQENRSFDNYFGTFPGASGIPMRHGVPTVCVPDPSATAAFGPTTTRTTSITADPMIRSRSTRTSTSAAWTASSARAKPSAGQRAADPENCNPKLPIDVMGYHNQHEIPNYWAYARDFVLQDHMFEPNSSWSLPAHLFLVSEWSALCADPGVPASCSSNIEDPGLPTDIGPPRT